jgi:hypothetical protein
MNRAEGQFAKQIKGCSEGAVAVLRSKNRLNSRALFFASFLLCEQKK